MAMNHTFRTTDQSGRRREWLLCYSEWRPTLWRVSTRVRSYGLFPTPKNARRFADGLELFPEHAGSIEVSKIDSASHLVWRGDDIGLGDRPATIDFVDGFGILRSFSVAVSLAYRTQIDPRGLWRIVSALRLMSNSGELHPDDLAAWREVEDEFPIIEIASGGTVL